MHIDKASALGDPETYKLPVPRVAGSEYDFSFSGLKTAVINMVHNASQKGTEINKNDMAASVQKTISEILVTKTILAAKDLGYKKIVLAGGVSANSGVRSALTAACEKNGFELFMPPLSLCGDNGAMIACQGYYNYLAGITADVSLNAVATMSIEKI